MINGWQVATIESMCLQVTSGGTPSRKVPKYFVAPSTGGTPWLKTKELDDRVIQDTEEHITAEAVSASSAKMLPKGTVAMAMYGATVGQLGILGKPMTCNQAVCAMVVDETRADNRFLFYSLLHNRDGIINLAVGSAQQNLSGQVIKNLRLPFPPLDEQRRIAGVLGALDDLIEVNRGLARNCEQLAQSLASTPSTTTVLSSFTTWGGLPTVKPIGTIDHYSLPAFDDEQKPERLDGSLVKSNKQDISQPCVLVARLNPHIPRVWMVYPDPSVSSLASTEFVPIHGDGVPDEVVYSVCSAPTYLVQMNGLVTGTTGSHQRVDKDALTSVEVPDVRSLPSDTLESISLLVKQAHALRVEISELSNTRDELLPLLMSGRVRVPADGVAA